MNKFLLTLSAATLLGTAAFAQTLETNEVTKTFADICDTWIRQGTPNNKYTGAASLETGHAVTKDETTQEITATSDNVALMTFEFEIPEGMKVKSAVMRLVTEKPGGLNLSVFEFKPFAEDCNWNTEGANVLEALKTDPITIFTLQGSGSNNLGEAYTNNKGTIENYINNVDITNYCKSLKASTTSISLIFAQQGDKAGSKSTIYSREATDFTYNDITIPAADLHPVLTVVFVEDANSFTETFSPIVDTYIRNDSQNNRSGEDSIQLWWNTTTDENENVVRNRQFYGFMSFENLPVELKSENYEIDSAELRLTTTLQKGDRAIDLYDYPENIDNNITWNKSVDMVQKVLQDNPITTFEAKGQNNKATWDGGITEQYQNVAEWQNYIDLTDYLKAKEDPTHFTLFITKQKVCSGDGQSTRFGTSESTGINNTSPTPFTFAAEDVKPQLKITYKKKETVGDDPTSIVEAIDSADVNAPVEYYNLQGVKIANPDRGIYIVRQGSKVRKVIL